MRALVEPAKRRGFRFEDEGLVEEMVGSVEGARGALPLLAFAVSRLWERRDRERKLLTRAAYEEVGGVAGALAQHAEATMDRIGTERQAVVREVFRNLVTAHGTRAVADREELLSVFPERKAAEEVLAALIDARLLTSYEVEGKEGEPSHHRIEIAHESLLKAWPRLVRWQAQDEEGAVLRDQLKQAAHLWEERGRPADLLWSGTSLREYELWRERYEAPLTASEEQFAKAMTDSAQRRRRRRRLAVSGAFVALVAVLAVIGVLLLRAMDERREAEASKLLTLAQLRFEDDPSEALAFATASLELADSQDARAFAMKVLWEAPPAFDLPAGASESPRAPAFSPDGRHLAAAGHTETASVWSDDGKEVAQLSGHGTSPLAPNVARWASPKRLVTGGTPLLHVWSIPEARRLRTIDPGAATFWSVEAGRVMASIWPRGVVGQDKVDLRSWELPDGPEQKLARIDWTALGAADWTFAPSGQGLIYAKGRAIVLRPLPAADGTRDRVIGRHETDVVRVNPLRGHPQRIQSLDKAGVIRIWSFSEGRLELVEQRRRSETAADAPVELELDGRLAHDALAGWASGRQLRLWDTNALASARPVTLRRNGSWYGAGVAFHPAGDWVAVATASFSRLTFWPLRQPRATVVPGYSGLTRPVAFSPDGRWLATTWSDGKLRLWPLPGTGSREPRILELPETTLWCGLAFDPKGRYLFAVGNSDRAWIVPLDGSPPRRLPVYSDESLLTAAAVSPSGRLVATAYFYGKGEKTLRVHDVEAGTTSVFPLPASGPGAASPTTGYESGVGDLAFADDTTLYSSGEGGVRRWRLPSGSEESVWAPEPGSRGGQLRLAGDGRTALVMLWRFNEECTTVRLLDLTGIRAAAAPASGECAQAIDRSADGSVAVVGDRNGTIRVGRLDGGAPHLLVGHEGLIVAVALSPDRRWVASTGEDSTLRLWPMPDLSKPPLSALPREALLAKLRSLTNLRAVRAPGESIGWKIELAPFPGWKDVPTW